MNSDDNVKHEIVTCRMTEQDYLMLREKSLDQGITMSDYIRYLVRIPTEITQQSGTHTCIVIDNKIMNNLLRETKRGNTIHNHQYHALYALSNQLEGGLLYSGEIAQLLEEVTQDMKEVQRIREEILVILREIRDKVFIKDDDKNGQFWSLWS